jgi:hypothetical protein
VSVADTAAAVVAALEAAGLRVAVRAGEITPPVVLVEAGTGSDIADPLPLEGATITTFWLHYIPIRGVDNLFGDAEALDTILAALSPVAWAPITWSKTSVTVRNDTWPGYRLDVALAGTTAPAAPLARS